MSSPCKNDPNEVISVISGAKVNAEKFDAFVNGRDTATVQLGSGIPTPTIRNAVRQFKAKTVEFAQILEDSALDTEGTDLSMRNAVAAGSTEHRTFATRFADIVNVKDFGAAGDGVTDDTAAWEAWQTALSSGGMGFVPAGSYLVNGKTFSATDGMFGNADGAFSIDGDFPNKTGLAKDQIVNYGRHSASAPEPAAVISNVVGPGSGVSQDVLVVIIAGASNAAGSANAGALQENYPEAGKFWCWTQGNYSVISNPSWKPLADPTSPTDAVGMDVSLALALHELAQKPVYIINVSRGSSGLAASRAWSWNSAPESNSCRSVAQTQIAAALSAITESGLTYKLLGVVWVEREATLVIDGTTTLEQFKEDQEDLNQWWRETIGAPKIWSAECNYSSGQTDASRAIMDAGNEVLREIAEEDSDFILATRRYLDVVPARDTHDGTHFYGKYYRMFGQDFAHAIYASMVGDLPMSSGLAGDATAVGIHAKSALSGTSPLAVHSIAGTAMHISNGGYVQGVYGAAFKTCAGGSGFAVGIRGKAATMAQNGAAGIVAGGMFEIENWSRDSSAGSAYSYSAAPVRCAIAARCDNYGTEAEAGLLIIGPSVNGCAGFWNAILVSGSSFAKANGKTGTVGINMSSFAGENYPETSIYFGKSTRHIALNNDSELRIHARTTELRGSEGNFYAQLRIISGGNYAGVALCNLSDSADRTSPHVVRGAVAWYPSGTYGNVGMRLRNPDSEADVNYLYVAEGAILPKSGSNLGSGSNRLNTVYATNGTIDTSDENAKQDIGDIPEAVFRAWGKVKFQQFRFRDAVERKGSDARIHVGAIAQRVKEAFESEGLDPFRYGLLCYDEWEDVYEEVPVVDVEEHVDEETGEMVPAQTHVERRLAVSAGSAFGIRYTEALALECAYQRWRLEQIEARLNEFSGNGPAPSGASPDNL